MAFHIGFAGYFSTRLCSDPLRAEQAACLFVDPRWPWPPWWVQFYRIGVVAKHERARKVVGAKGRHLLVEGITNPHFRKLELLRNCTDEEDNHATLHVYTGQRIHADWYKQSFDVTGRTRGHELPEGADLLTWVELMHELMVTLDVAHAVLPVWPTVNAVVSDTTFTRIVLDSPKGEYLMGVRGEFERQRARASYWRPQLGADYVRHPRWGTYLRHAHLDRVGGLEKLRGSVPLARVLDLGDLVFLQCTEHPSTALTPEGERVRRALEDALAPILVPARPGEEADAPSV